MFYYARLPSPLSSHPILSVFAFRRHWLKGPGVQFIYIDPFNNFSSVKNGDKCLSPRVGTDGALAESIAYVWLTEDTYV